MNKDAVDAFKRELKNYKYYKINLEGTLRLIEMNEYLLSNVHGVNPEKEPNGSSGSIAWVETETYDRITKELERLYERRDLRLKQIEYIDDVLTRMNSEIAHICKSIYLNDRSYSSISKELNLSKSSLHEKVEKELQKVLNS